ncbi:LytR C-terminal domain-containing protein [Propionicimonas sp.]|uniref:LytR C-terminal domain-containing protein n=1 Tax=Propionicimonas sp. TaxID=1955623 RepID=UPI00178FB907|nr:LytR C-terminal domain-containing protein [Propionicimonas sp.]MBU3975664.1 LytR C-terminal domain-containing protein [Actinomycetota bacterium]MBA3019933.1 LytR family transcriptional regulator [Propionicimonas sp.]MBU3986187.1 LytR C-terminal domain-containing protein [Actinomycetota bacterium]MBU4007756.1 LytR C-terminal domain-containing protein [Actinomycetota bacterium]MBU4064014.1 LytR C-terminal domain-containing protein [Actinomycetota bacterium]
MEQLNQVIRVLKTPVTLIVLLLFVIGAGFWSLKAVSAPSAKTANPCVSTDVGKELTPNRVSIRVLNASETPRQAKDTAAFVRPYGFNVIRVNNSERQVPVTTIIGYAADSPEVLLVQQFFPGSVTEGDGRADHVVDVLLGPNAERAVSPVTSLPVSGQVCLPPRTVNTPAPSASATTATSPAPSATK